MNLKCHGYFFGCFILILSGSGPRLCAQEVTSGPILWFSTEPSPDELPRGRNLRPDFPIEMRNATEPGYVVVDRALDATGKGQSLAAHGTEVPYQRAVENEFRDWTMSPAKRGGQAVNARIWLAVIFNPKAASARGPDATPRLLSVAPVTIRDRPPSGGIVRMRISLDAAGIITAAAPVEGTNLPPRSIDAIKDALAQWRFAPARHAGEAVATTIIVPVLCQPPLSADAASAKTTLPRVLRQERPDYPPTMLRYGLNGQVMVRFEVDTEGKVVNPVVVESDNPAFEEPALKAVMKWKFQPATRDGQPVKVTQMVPMIFELNDARGKSGAINLKDNADQSKLPAELRYDTLPKFRSVFIPVYPFELRRDGVRGKAVVAMFINPQGRVAQIKVLSADRPEFGLALSAAVVAFRFDPAFKDGKPVPHLLKFEQEFNPALLPDEEGDTYLTMEKKRPDRIVGANKLDAMPTPKSRRPPIFPLNVPAGTTDGEALIEFLIDEEGHARLPRSISATDPAFAYAAVQAVNSWMFSPPSMGGKPVVARVQIPVMFSLKGAGASGSPAAEKK